MLLPRIIPFLMIHNKGLYKSVQFKDYKYVGDPINAVKIFNEKEVDELIIADIDATTRSKVINYKLIENLASESRMPLCYCGGIKNLEQAEKILSLGVEKIGLSSIAIEKPEIISKISSKIGNQSVVVVIDVKKSFFSGEFHIRTHNGKNKIKENLFKFIEIAQSLGAGEILINFIDKDGTMNGYNLDLIEQIYQKCAIPLTVIGGAADFSDIQKCISKFGIIGTAAGSCFVFKGKYKAVLINYPTKVEKNRLMKDYINNKR